MSKALGMLEFTSIAKGMEAADAMTKAADIRLEEAKTICPGKYLIIVSGDVAAVSAAVEAGEAVGRQTIVDRLLIASIHEELLAGLNGSNDIGNVNSVGVIEFFSVASAVIAADAAAKAADVKMIEVRLAMAIGGKSFIVMTGELSAVNAAVDAGVMAARDAGMLIGKTVIPSPTKEFFQKLL
ncbi:BMC domain-containing protein [Endozoicomonas elysicola]|uniref:Propanediol utilization protein n=1 Tax=Endozoicomonas elysicola TaxID=305900 RepID=A0A081K5K9_9GAMM|nr:BMC domain-containing protein [Endozoicomonas elysicola]KEI69435.1 propanediol utilization protein [Endozoicomonas elysicola]